MHFLKRCQVRFEIGFRGPSERVPRDHALVAGLVALVAGLVALVAGLVALVVGLVALVVVSFAKPMLPTTPSDH